MPNPKLLCTLVALTLSMTASLQAQKADDGAFWTMIGGQRVLTEVMQVQGADPDEICELLRHFFDNDDANEPFDAFVINSTRSIVVRCNPKKMEDVRVALRKLDQPRLRGMPTETVILKCVHRRAEELVESANVQLTKGGRLAVDVARNTIVVRDTGSGVQAVRQVIAALDRPTAQLTVEFHILGPNGAPLNKGGLGENLQRELTSLGLAGYGVVSHTMVRSLEGDQFEISESNSFRRLSIRGKAKRNDNGEVADLEFSLVIHQVDGDDQSEVKLKTSLRVPLGDRSIVGLAPTGEDGSQPMVLVVRVRSSD